jgi:signal transduction histidine kinase
VNDAVVKHSKLSRKELIGSTMEACYPGIEKTEVFAKIQECQRTKQSQEWINEFDFPDGSRGYFQLRMQALTDGVLIMSYDVTDQKKAERLIANTNAYLEEIVKTRTRELVEQKIIIEHQLAQVRELNAAKDKFFSIVAHDLLAPLNSLKGLSNLITRSLDDPDKNDLGEINQRLHKSLDKTITLAESLISWGRAQMAAKNKVNFEDINLHTLISDVCGLYKDLAEKKGVKLSYQADENLIASVDKNHMSFILRNLINNAIKYTHAKGQVAVEAVRHVSNKIQISVSDNGVGISETIRKNIHDLSIKNSLDGTEGEKGTGLGLMLCYEFIKLNKGEIEIEKNKNSGTRFNLLLSST